MSIIKITDTRMHQVTKQVMLGTQPTRVEEVPVAEAELVLVKDGRGGLYKTNKIDSNFKLTPNDLLTDKIRQGWSPNQYSPILISHTEKIEVGDLVYQHNTKKIHEVTEIKNGLLYFHKDNVFTPVGNCNKIIALPEHFSPKHLQAIVDGKMKEGDNVLAECEYIQKEWKEKNGNFIKLNSLNHITIHKKEQEKFNFNKIEDLRPYLIRHPDAQMVRSSCLHYLGDRFQQFDLKKEEKMILISKVNELLHEFNQTGYSYKKRSYKETQEWFEQNVK